MYDVIEFSPIKLACTVPVAPELLADAEIQPTAELRMEIMPGEFVAVTVPLSGGCDDEDEDFDEDDDF